MSIFSSMPDISNELGHFGLIVDLNYPRYFCTPVNTQVFGGVGCDGIHFCILKNGFEIDDSPVYVVSPMMPGHYVELVAENITDFLGLLVSCKDAALIEYISYSSENQFNTSVEKLNDEIANDEERSKNIAKALHQIRQLADIPDIRNAYQYTKELRTKKFDHAVLEFDPEYHSLIE